MKFTSSLAIAGMVALLGASAAMAQTPAPAPAAPAAATKPAPAAMAGDKAAVSKTCSDQADAKKLHGKERRKFRAECKRTGGKTM
jgi:psiF repeat